MKEVLEKLVGLIPAYFDALLPLLTGPKKFVAERLSGDESAIQKALFFLAVSFLIGWLLKTPLGRGDPLLGLGPDAVFRLVGVMGYGGALYLGWRIVGGRAALQKFLTIHFYFAGILSLLMTAMFLGMMGTIRAFDPALYKEIYEALYSGNTAAFMIKNSERMMATPGYWVGVVGYGAILVWIHVGWGAYRELNRLSRVRSFAAGLLFLVFCVPVTALLFFVANALIK